MNFFSLNNLLTLSLLEVNLSYADNLCKQFGPDQDLQNIGPDLDPNSLTLIVFCKEFFFEKFDFEKKSAEDYKA